MAKEIIVVSLGGSLIVPPEGIDHKFLKKFRALIVEEIKKGKRFIITSGGGQTCRTYQNTAKQIAKINNVDLDWIGLYVNRMHAQLIRSIFGSIAHKKIVEYPKQKINFTEKILTSGGFQPGYSSDMVAVKLAKKFKVKTLINLSNIKYVYDKDPKKYKTAKKITKISWPDFRKIVGNKWDPGLNAPFDPIASQLAQKLGLEVIIAEGRNINNLAKILNNKKFFGTTIK